MTLSIVVSKLLRSSPNLEHTTAFALARYYSVQGFDANRPGWGGHKPWPGAVLLPGLGTCHEHDQDGRGQGKPRPTARQHDHEDIEDIEDIDIDEQHRPRRRRRHVRLSKPVSAAPAAAKAPAPTISGPQSSGDHRSWRVHSLSDDNLIHPSKLG